MSASASSPATASTRSPTIHPFPLGRHDARTFVIPKRLCGFFIAGKYEQLRGSAPYSGLGLALRQLVRQLLARSDAELQSWREAIRTALGTSAAMLLPMVPDLALIVGENMPVYEISGMEARHRLECAFEGLLSVFAARHHPLVLFLDDVQWADAASLELLAALARNR